MGPPESKYESPYMNSFRKGPKAQWQAGAFDQGGSHPQDHADPDHVSHTGDQGKDPGEPGWNHLGP